MKTFRRKIVKGHKTGSWRTNWYRCTLSCGHTNQLTGGYGRTMPKTTECTECRKAAEKKP